MGKDSLSERDICTKFITPAIVKAGWDIHSQIREEVSFTKGRIMVRGKPKRADYVLYYKPNIALALIEAKDGTYPVGSGMQQWLGAIVDTSYQWPPKELGKCLDEIEAANPALACSASFRNLETYLRRSGKG